MWISKIKLWKTATFRVSVFFSLAITAVTAVVLVFVYWQVVKRDTAHQNRVLAEEVARGVNQTLPQLTREVDLRITRDLRAIDYAALFDSGGKLLSGNVDALPAALPIDGETHTIGLISRSNIRRETVSVLVVARRRQDGSVLLLGRNLSEVYAFRQIVLEALALGVVPSLLLAFIVGTIFSLRATKRLKAINRKIISIMQGNLTERLPTHGLNDDLDHVGRAVNLMLDEIVRLLDQIKSVGDNIAHDLRSPLAVMRIGLERALDNGSSDDLRSSAEKALGTLDRVMTTVAALLRISDIEYGRRTSGFKTIDLVEVCANAFDLYQPLADAKRIVFTLIAPEPLQVHGDFDLLVEAVANLIDNAIKFTPAGGFVEVAAKSESGKPVVRISDSGPGVASQERGAIFKRRYRSDATRHLPGIGLGLHMASTIAQLHGFDLCVADCREGAAFEMSLRDAA
ncbi:sensor histidine kinase [Methylocapsa palsarum]|uniref:histidine kinase n=1 Tax=Methylocapsa palsarum TaxID=1612308 RepID=A0A1I4B0C2_9HYPH|nr:HAMP domain-containing sensor histidine kinase [Methylocapsa palsarum]SFK61369.1 Signal transduction histidine kinase [Methylocapsa palsarum]